MHLSKVIFNSTKYPTHDKYPFNLKLLCKTPHITFTKPVTLFVGENGTGKSTLLKAICLKWGLHIWQFDEGGRFEINPFEQQLYKYIDVEWINGFVPGSYFASRDTAKILTCLFLF